VKYRSLLPTLDHWFAQGSADASPGIVPCRAGCTACCHGPFDISPADARLVAQSVARLDAASRAAMQLRAGTQLARYREVIPEWGPPWDITALGDEAFDELVETLAELPCPALGEDGACVIYAGRPATCRMIGLPMADNDGEVLENNCPIQGDFPEYALLAPVPFDLEQFESDAEACDDVAMDAGWGITTVAGAVACAPAPAPQAPG
jgi:Fe-S-cluster containining protein